MKLKARHWVEYRYDRAVDLLEHKLRLKPFENDFQKIENFKMKILPVPKSSHFVLDRERNTIESVYFYETTKILQIETNWTIITNQTNPFDYKVELKPIKNIEQFIKLDHFENELKCEIGDEFKRLADDLYDGEDYIQVFVNKVNMWIFENIEMQTRYTEDLQSADQTLKSKRGACRDVAWLMIQICRYKKIPSTFVSGYCFHGESHISHELHAWVEIWIPNGGWRGYDPSIGLAVSDRHICIAISAIPQETLSVEGNYLGMASSFMKYDIQIEEV